MEGVKKHQLQELDKAYATYMQETATEGEGHLLSSLPEALCSSSLPLLSSSGSQNS